MDTEPYAAIAVIEREVATKVANFVALHNQNLGQLAGAGTQNLWDQLHAEQLIPKGLDLGFLGAISPMLVPRALQGNRAPLDVLRTLLHGAESIVDQLLAADSPEDVLQIGQSLLTQALGDLGKTIGPLLASQLNILVSFATTLATLPLTAGPAVEDALLQYFFTSEGFETVDGLRIVAPVHLSDIDVAALGQVKALFSERTGERYLRDLVRLTVEAADDARYNDLKSRYAAMLGLLGDDSKRAKFTNWFKGFASIAEAAVTSSVEQACLGAASFQTNALIAASAGTFAGTAARKAAQHVFLGELEHLRLVP